MSGLSAAAPLRPHYDGRGRALGGITFRTTVLTVLTLLVYRFWARTRVRRYVWSHVEFEGDRFEYTGSGAELFLGFLRVVLIFAPLSILIAILNAFVLPGLNNAQLPVFVILAIVGSYYARRYRLTRTRWRGIRGNLVGNAGAYLGLSLLHLLHTALTLGLTYPFYRLATGRYLIAHSWFGDRQFTCVPRYVRLFLRYAPIWLVTIGLLAAGVMALEPAIVAGMRGDRAAAANLLPAAGARGVILIVAAILWWAVMFSLYRLWEFRALMDATRFGDLLVHARPRWRILFGAWLATIFVALLAAALCFGSVAGGAFLARGAIPLLDRIGPAIGAVIGIFLIYPLFLAIKDMFWTNALIAELINTIEMSGEVDFARLAQNCDYAPAVGEGLFDIFDFAG